MQWKEQVLPPEGEARHDHWIMAELFLRVRELYEQRRRRVPGPGAATSPFPTRIRAKPELDEIAQEINGKDLTHRRAARVVRGRSPTTATRPPGNWIYVGSYPESGNLAKRRNGVQDPETNDPTGMGFYPEWAWSLAREPAHALQPRLGRPAGKPWDPKRAGIQWDAAQKLWVGDVPDYPPDADPADRSRRCRSS